MLKSKLPEDVDRSPESDDELENVEVHTSNIPTFKLLEDILFSEDRPENNFDKETKHKFNKSHPDSTELSDPRSTSQDFNILLFNFIDL